MLPCKFSELRTYSTSVTIATVPKTRYWLYFNQSHHSSSVGLLLISYKCINSFILPKPKPKIASLRLRFDFCKESQLWLSFSPAKTELSNDMPPEPPAILFSKMPKTRCHSWTREESGVLLTSWVNPTRSSERPSQVIAVYTGLLGPLLLVKGLISPPRSKQIIRVLSDFHLVLKKKKL